MLTDGIASVAGAGGHRSRAAAAAGVLHDAGAPAGCGEPLPWLQLHAIVHVALTRAEEDLAGSICLLNALLWMWTANHCAAFRAHGRACALLSPAAHRGYGLCVPAGPAFGDFAEPVFERCLRIASSQVAEKSQQVGFGPLSQSPRVC